MDFKDEMDRIRAIKPDFEGFYKIINDVRLPVKFYKPKKKQGSGVAFLIIHGGAWHAIKEDSSKWIGSNMQFQAQYYADKGFTTVEFSYRDINITEDTTGFDLIEDCKDAIDFMKKHIGFDKLVVIGESAGGHLAVELALDNEVGVDVVVGINPVLDVVNKWSFVAKNDEDRTALSPTFNVKKSDARYLIMHGTADVNVDPAISEKFVQDMTAMGCDCKYIGINEEVHSFIISRYRSTDDKVFEYMRIIDEYLESTGIYEPNPAEYFNTFKSNTTAGLGNHYTFTSDGTEKLGRIFYKISAPGTYNYSFTFSGTVDTTYSDGTIGEANKICPDFEITKLMVAAIDINDKHGSFDFENVTFSGKDSVKITNGKTVYSDSVKLVVNEGEFICFEISYRGTEIPKIHDRMVSSCVYDGARWVDSGDVPAPGFIGCDKKFKKSVVFIGDSITQGVGTEMDSYSHYVSEVGKLLGDDVSIRNIGLGFARAKDAATKGEWLRKTKYADVVVVCLGVNDLLHDNLSTENTLCGFYDIILSELSDGKRKIVWQTVPPANYNSVYKIDCWNTANNYIKNVISDKVTAVFDTVPVLRKSEKEPHVALYGLHPNATGCKLWAKNLAPIIECILK